MGEHLYVPGIDFEEEMKPGFEVGRLCEGLEFGHGEISSEDMREVLQVVDETVTKSPDLLVPIDKDDEGNVIDDDGCGDGRDVLTVFSGDKKLKRSLNRPKVFGGAATMATASLIGLNEAPTKSLNAVFDAAIDRLIERKINFGAHTDEHAHGEKCGCGAIDNAGAILSAELKYEFPIRGVISRLGIHGQEIDDVYMNFRNYVNNVVPHQPAFSGRQVMDRIIEEAKVVKQLGGPHRELGIVLNTARDHTVNQQLIRDVTADKGQIFAVDVWRLEDLSKGLYPENPHKQLQSLLSMLVYTLATSGVLTKGNLPVYMIEPESAAVSANA